MMLHYKISGSLRVNSWADTLKHRTLDAFCISSIQEQCIRECLHCAVTEVLTG